MINKLMQMIAPYYCYGCAKVGVPLCIECKFDIIDEAADACIVCQTLTNRGICSNCQTFYTQAWCIGERNGALRNLIDALKFERVADAAGSLASLLDERLPVLPDNTIIVPVPTIASHVRQRGYDHTLLIAKKFAKKRQLQVSTPLERIGSNVQRGKNKRDRFKQAQASYQCRGQLDPNRTYLLLDDIVTTNATLQSCAAALQSAGAREVWVAVIARQGLDK